ncbi:hypothetical protein [Bradyrhizobium sp. Bra64]|uniref:hypothetical protein n=1 Tax=Bradyrhizobium sp. Bra64 TaxID=2926009 RepID=UPI0021191BDF|nr:hypothetical protein [Bradyrhizobium sp. Bra64]
MASSDIIPAERRSAQGNVSIASGRAASATTDGCFDFRRREDRPPNPPRSAVLNQEAELNRACKLLLAITLPLPVMTGVAADELGQGDAHRHHPPQDRLLHEKFYSSWHMPDNPVLSCCNDSDCYPTEIQYVDGRIFARRREDGKYILIPPQKVERNRDNPDGRNHLCAPPPSASLVDTVYCFALGGAT